MRLAFLFSRSRLAGPALAGLALIALLAWAAGHAILSRPDMHLEYLSPVLIFAALLAACVAGVSTYSPFGEVEHVSSFPLSALRFGHLAGLLACAALAFLIVALLWGQDFAALLLLRDLAGLSGLAFFTAFMLGGRLSWTLPFAFVAIIPLVGDGSGERKWAWWAWVDQPAGDSLSWTLATVSLVLGLGLVCLRGAADTLREAE